VDLKPHNFRTIGVGAGGVGIAGAGVQVLVENKNQTNGLS